MKFCIEFSGYELWQTGWGMGRRKETMVLTAVTQNILTEGQKITEGDSIDHEPEILFHHQHLFFYSER